MEYRSALAESLDEHSRRMQPRSPKPRNYADVAVGQTGCNLSATLTTQKPHVGVRLWICGTDDEAVFRLLKEEREAIEDEIGVWLDWQPRPGKESFVIASRWEADSADRQDWPAQHQRMTELLDASHRAFSPCLKQIDVRDWAPPSRNGVVPVRDAPRRRRPE